MLGDLVSKGIDSKGVVQQLIDLEKDGVNVIRIVGNHELMLLAMQRLMGLEFELPHIPQEMLSNVCASFFVRSNGTWSILKSYGFPGVDDQRGWLFKAHGPEKAVPLVFEFAQTMPWNLPQDHLEFIAAARPFHIERNCLFVHAGLHPDHLNATSAAAAAEAQLLNEPSELSWNRDWLGMKPGFPELIIHGHTPLPYLYCRVEDTSPWKDDDLVFKSVIHQNAINLDSGVFMDSGHLTAVEIPENGSVSGFEFIRVPRLDPVAKDPLWYLGFT